MRAPNHPSSRPKPPQNYSGNAFSPSGLFYNSMPPPIRQSQKRSDIPTENNFQDHNNSVNIYKQYPINDSIESIGSNAQDPDTPDLYDDINSKEQYTSSDREAPSNRSTHISPPKNNSIFSSLIPSFSSNGHFPFGHGIGGEEMFILGMMLLIYLSGNDKNEIDNELILMLGLLLLAG